MAQSLASPTKHCAMKRVYLSILLALIIVSISAQQRRRTGSLAFGIQVVQPTGNYANVYDGYPAGLSGNFSIPLGRSPFEAGGGFSWNAMGSQEEDISVLMGQDVDGDDIYEMGTMRIRSNNYRYMLLGRFRPFVGRVQVYADALAGVESFSTKTDIQLENQGYSEVIESDVDHRDFTFNYGWALGARIQLAQGIYLDGRFEKLQGGLARYVDPETIEVNAQDNGLQFDVRESQTDKFTYQLGVAFQF